MGETTHQLVQDFWTINSMLVSSADPNIQRSNLFPNRFPRLLHPAQLPEEPRSGFQFIARIPRQDNKEKLQIAHWLQMYFLCIFDNSWYNLYNIGTSVKTSKHVNTENTQDIKYSNPIIRGMRGWSSTRTVPLKTRPQIQGNQQRTQPIKL